MISELTDTSKPSLILHLTDDFSCEQGGPEHKQLHKICHLQPGAPQYIDYPLR